MATPKNRARCDPDAALRRRRRGRASCHAGWQSARVRGRADHSPWGVGSSVAAAGGAATAAGTRRRHRGGEVAARHARALLAADRREHREQLDGVVVAIGALGRQVRRAHRTALFEYGVTGAATELVGRHGSKYARTLLRSAHCARSRRVFAGRASPRLFVGAAAAIVSARGALGRWGRRDAAAVTAVLAGRPFAEWLIHRRVLHSRPSRGARSHDRPRGRRIAATIASPPTSTSCSSMPATRGYYVAGWAATAAALAAVRPRSPARTAAADAERARRGLRVARHVRVDASVDPHGVSPSASLATPAAGAAPAAPLSQRALLVRRDDEPRRPCAAHAAPGTIGGAVRHRPHVGCRPVTGRAVLRQNSSSKATSPSMPI